MVLPTDPAPGIRTGHRNGAGHTDRCSTRCMRTAHGSCDRPDFGPPVTTGSHTDSDRSTGTISIDPAPGIHSNDRCCTGSIDRCGRCTPPCTYTAHGHHGRHDFRLPASAGQPIDSNGPTGPSDIRWNPRFRSNGRSRLGLDSNSRSIRQRHRSQHRRNARCRTQPVRQHHSNHRNGVSNGRGYHPDQYPKHVSLYRHWLVCRLIRNRSRV